MAEPALAENIISLGQWLQYWMGLYSSMHTYETQTGAIAEPTTASRGDGHVVTVYNSTYDILIDWTRCNSDTEWRGNQSG